MSTTMLSDVPLLGALCITAGLISQAQLAHCLELQTHTYPGTPIGRILVLQGYCSEPDVARMIAQQQAFRREFCAALEQSSSSESAVVEVPVLIVEAPVALPVPDAVPLSGAPLLGALCIAAGLISQAQLTHCLELQTHKYLGTPIGRILVIQGYCSEPDVARMIAQQQAFRREFCAALDHTSQAPSADAPVLEPVIEAAPLSALPELGAFAATELDNSHIFGTRK